MVISVAKMLLGLILLVVALGAWLCASILPPALPEADASAFSLVNVTVINPMMDRTDGVSLRVGGDRIEFAGEDSAHPALHEYQNHYVTPGFSDMHTHLAGDNILKLTPHYGLLHLAYGVTTIRDAGDIDGTATPAARAAIEEGAPFPRLISCGPFVSNGAPVWPNTVQLERPEDADALVRKLASAGYGCIKAYEGLTPPLTTALVEAARTHGLHVIGHVPVERTLEESGLPDIQHFFGVPPPGGLGGESVLFRNGDWSGVDEARLVEVSEFIVSNEIRSTPTLGTLESLGGFRDHEAAAAASARSLPGFFANVIWNPESGLPVYRDIPEERLEAAETTLRGKQALVKRLSDAGAVLHLGTDVGQPFTAPGVSYWQEMRLFEAAGVSAEQVLAYATNVAARSLGAETGVIADGRPADFLIFSSDPTRRLDALDTLVAVVRGGRLFSKSDLDAAVEARLAHYGAWPLSALATSAAEDLVREAARNF